MEYLVVHSAEATPDKSRTKPKDSEDISQVMFIRVKTNFSIISYNIFSSEKNFLFYFFFFI